MINDKYEAIEKLHEIRADVKIDAVYRIWIAEIVNFLLTDK